MSIPPEELFTEQPVIRGKAALKSKGVWGGTGGILASLAVLGQALVPLIEGTGEVDLELAGAGLVGLVSGALAVWGRIQARRPIAGFTQDI